MSQSFRILLAVAALLSVSFSLFALEDAVLSEIKRLGFEVGAPTQQAEEVLPEKTDLTGPYWGLMRRACEKGGYDLAAFAGKNVLFSRFPPKKKDNPRLPDVCVYSDKEKIACVFLLDTDPNVADSIYPVKNFPPKRPKK